MLYYYENTKLDKNGKLIEEKVYEDDWQNYALTQLGLMHNGELVVVPKGKNGEYTLEQLDNFKETTDWYFSGNWVKKIDREDEENDEDYNVYLEDKIYEENLERKLLENKMEER